MRITKSNDSNSAGLLHKSENVIKWRTKMSGFGGFVHPHNDNEISCKYLKQKKKSFLSLGRF